MDALRKLRFAAWHLALAISVLPCSSLADDIDIFVGSSAGASANPNILIVLDNTTNWADQAQHWPDAATQGYSEVMAIKQVIAALSGTVNVGLMMYPFNAGGADGGFIRQAVVPMTDANRSAFGNRLDTISNGINGNPNEGASSSRANGTIMFDAYKYFGGYSSPAHANDDNAGAPTDSTHYGPTPYASSASVPAAYADSAGYSTNYTSFASPIGNANSCAKNFVIYIGNGFPSGTDSSTLLSNVGCDASLLPRPILTATTTTNPTALGTTGQCYASQASCTGGAPEVASCPAGYDNCACTTTAAGNASCPAGQDYYTVTRSISVNATTGCINTNHDNTGPQNAQAYSCPGTGCSYTLSARACGGQSRDFNVTYTSTSTNLSSQCYGSAVACTANAAEGGSCAAPTANSNACAAGSSRYNYVGNIITATTSATGSSEIPTGNAAKSLADVWAKCLYQTDVSSAPGQQNVTTYTIDVYNAKPDAKQNSLLYNMAKHGGGRYFPARSAAAIKSALQEILVEIQSVNSTFASASLPISATNRAQNANQVFIGMFRPDADAKPRWFGNLKRYQLITDAGGNVQLGDVNAALAINNNTGFISDCATSWWTSDSDRYWSDYPITPSPAGSCSTTPFDVYSDAPDGPRVEKGAVAEVLRKGNNPPATDAVPTRAVNRTVYTASGTTLLPFDAANTGLSQTMVNWVLGQDTEAEKLGGASTETRASIHGDVVHSRPLAVNYCLVANCSNVIAYYGANDGSLRAVDTQSGKEKWAFIAPESNPYLDRLRTQSPLVNYPGVVFPVGLNPSPTRRDYAMDGSLGIYQNADNSAVWIYPTMRRGGRMIYALDVTDPLSPTIKWKFGCPNQANDTDCTAGASAIGQTWSVPNVAFIKGYSTVNPVLVVGGGYDSCEDSDSASPACANGKGKIVYVLNASSGAVLASFTTLRSVVADTALIDIDFDGFVDYAYVADTGGNLYRINFSSWNSATTTSSPQASNAWTITRVAYTSGSGRKFLFGPSLFGAKGVVYVALGSGDREHPLQSSYPFTGPVSNRFYVYRECIPSSPNASSLAGGDNLDDEALMNHSTATNPAACAAAQTLATNCASNKGWFIDLNNGTGEQTVTAAAISGGMVTFSTNRPIPAAAGTCSTALGEARGYWLDLFKGSGAIGTSGNTTCGGLASTKFVGGGLPPSPILATVPINGVPVSVVIGAAQRSGATSSAISPQKAAATNLPARKRVYTVIKGEN